VSFLHCHICNCSVISRISYPVFHVVIRTKGFVCHSSTSLFTAVKNAKENVNTAALLSFCIQQNILDLLVSPSYEDLLKSFASFVIIFIRVVKLDKTRLTQLRDFSPPPYVTSNPQPSVTPVQYQSKRKAVRTFDSKNVPLLSYCVTKKKSPLRQSWPYAGSVWDKYDDVSRVRRWARQFKQ
jgi:hypothetical protein